VIAPVTAAGPANELKFLLDERQAREVEAAARGLLAPDPHGDPALGGAYATTCLYCDTPRLDVYFRSPSYRRHKFRVRRYGAAPWVFLERRTRADGRVVKRRTPLPETELPLLAGLFAAEAWAGRWFQRRLQLYRLAPAGRVAYERTAFAGWRAAGAVRLTLDRRVRGAPACDWGLSPVEGGRPLLEGGVILKFKFREALPAPFRVLMEDLNLRPSAASKYRLYRQAFGPPACRAAVGV
jgi:hypothetical protein